MIGTKKAVGWRGRIGSVVGALVVLALNPEGAMAQSTVFGQVVPKSTSQVVITPGGGVNRRLGSGGTWGLHAGATVVGAPAPNPDVKHNPAAGQPAAANVLPVGILNPNDPADKQKAAPVPLAGGAVYAFNPQKNFTIPPAAKVINTSGVAMNAVTTPANAAGGFPQAFTTTARAEAQVSFVEDPAKIYTVNPEKSFAAIDNPIQKVPRFGQLPLTRSGPNGMAASLVLDPLTFTGIAVGDTLRGDVAFEKANFQMQNNAFNAVFASVNEVGTDMLGVSAGTLGTSFITGNPLIYRLRISLTSDSKPIVSFEANPGFIFYNPDDPTQTNLSDPNAFVQARFAADLNPAAMPGDLFTLTNDLDLIDYKRDATQAQSTLSVDYLLGQDANASAVPEPSSMVLLGLGLLGLLGYTAWRGRESLASSVETAMPNRARLARPHRA